MRKSMNIIICDDSQNDRKILIELLQSYAQEKKQCFEMIEYDSGASLCEDESALQKCQLVFLDINMEDNHKLYLESAKWIGVPYRGGGDSKRGTDCSGLTYQIYRKVYRTQVPRNTEDLRKESTKVAKRNLREGDLVFFSSSRSRKKVAHVGIYLKNGKFIHASTSKGVIVSRLSEDYYTRHWISGGRIR